MTVRIHVYLVCFCLGSKYTPNTQPNTQVVRCLPVQSAGWSPDVERWESDEDSEHSGDEREGDEQEVALSEAAILRLMA